MCEGGSFKQAWLTETLRVREAHWGQLQDGTEVRRARAEGGTFAQRLVRRAQYLGQREKLTEALGQWTTLSQWSLAIMLLVAILAGAGTALGALGDGVRSVNLLLALAAMLGLHSLTLILWLIGIAVPAPQNGPWLGRIWLGVTRKLARGPDAGLAPRALVGLLGRSGALRWVLSAISHLLWLAALISLLATLLVLLSARRYTFNWETTLLSPDAFVSLTNALGWLPRQFGFAMPSDGIIRISDGLNALPPEAHALWSGWLIGCVVVYGIVPRLIAAVFSVVLARRGLRRAAVLDTALPGYTNLRPRLMPPSETIAPDARPGPKVHYTTAPQANLSFTSPGLLLGLELAPASTWPPLPLPEGVHNGGIIDSRAQRHALLDQLHKQPVERLLVVCDAFQTPDRGISAFISELAAYAKELRVVLVTEPHATPVEAARHTAWRAQLAEIGISAQQLFTAPGPALRWLSGASHDEHEAS